MSDTADIRRMKLAIKEAQKTVDQNIGGPFGALIINAQNDIIAVASNTVLGDHDPTAHAEMNAIRIASKVLRTHDLSGCTLYTTSYPCPMCLGAIIWANIETVYYGCTAKDAEKIGFRDEMIYDFIKGKQSTKHLDFKQIDRDSCLSLFDSYHQKHKIIY